jgi:hypothetical protein
VKLSRALALAARGIDRQAGQLRDIAKALAQGQGQLAAEPPKGKRRRTRAIWPAPAGECPSTDAALRASHRLLTRTIDLLK